MNILKEAKEAKKDAEAEKHNNMDSLLRSEGQKSPRGGEDNDVAVEVNC